MTEDLWYCGSVLTPKAVETLLAWYSGVMDFMKYQEILNKNLAAFAK